MDRRLECKNITEGSAPSRMTPLDYFYCMFSWEIVRLTNSNLPDELTSPREILKFFGVITLIPRFDFSDRKELGTDE